MESLESDMGFDLPSSLKFDTFSMISTPLTENQNESMPMRLGAKLGRGLGDIQSKRNQFIVNGTYRNSEDWISQIEYDRFMNEVWVGIVLTLIVISLVFCICSCFLYHQFRQWKRNYHRNIRRSVDIESVKLNVGDDDSLPDYTLVSGLPSYDAALEQLKMSPEKCLLVQTSIYEIFPIIGKQSSSNANGQLLPLTNHQKGQLSYAKASLTEDDEKLDISDKVPSYAEALVESR